MGVELEHLLDRKPTTLSGGEKQRVALGRCITRDAAVFLVDEPFANLDQALREKYRVNLKALLRQFEITTVYVTHDHHEALILADLIAVMDRGRIEQVGTPQEIYDEPRNLFVAGFLNLDVGAPPLGLLDAERLPGSWPATVRIGVRPEDVELVGEGRDDAMPGVVTERLTLPGRHATLLTIRIGEDLIHARTSATPPPGPGDVVRVAFRRYHLFDKASGRRLESALRA
jgi:multiple sugar transport system ATP-binding protein